MDGFVKTTANMMYVSCASLRIRKRVRLTVPFVFMFVVSIEPMFLLVTDQQVINIKLCFS